MWPARLALCTVSGLTIGLPLHALIPASAPETKVRSRSSRILTVRLFGIPDNLVRTVAASVQGPAVKNFAIKKYSSVKGRTTRGALDTAACTMARIGRYSERARVEYRSLYVTWCDPGLVPGRADLHPDRANRFLFTYERRRNIWIYGS